MRKNNHSAAFYEKKFNEIRNYATNKGLQFPFRNVREFESSWNALKEDGVKQIDRSIKYGLEYNTDYKTALAEYKIAKELGLDYTFKGIKKLTTTEFAEQNQDAIMDLYNRKRDEGMTGSEAGSFISTYWFGSK